MVFACVDRVHKEGDGWPVREMSGYIRPPPLIAHTKADNLRALNHSTPRLLFVQPVSCAVDVIIILYCCNVGKLARHRTSRSIRVSCCTLGFRFDLFSFWTTAIRLYGYSVAIGTCIDQQAACVLWELLYRTLLVSCRAWSIERIFTALFSLEKHAVYVLTARSYLQVCSDVNTQSCTDNQLSTVSAVIPSLSSCSVDSTTYLVLRKTMSFEIETRNTEK